MIIADEVYAQLTQTMDAFSKGETKMGGSLIDGTRLSDWQRRAQTCQSRQSESLVIYQSHRSTQSSQRSASESRMHELTAISGR
jgi:hypothetical protein